jgi:hypothetical protein
MSSSFEKYSDKICTQRKANGDPCQSPSLAGERFCRFHKVMGKPDINIDNGPSGHAYLPAFEDAVSIQSAISDVCEMMLHRRIEIKEASILLYAMQVASTNMAHLNGHKGQRMQPSQKKYQKSNAEPSVAPSSTEAPVSAATPNDASTASSGAQPLKLDN